MDVTTSYEAELEREYRDLTKKHKDLRQQLENGLSIYLGRGKGKPYTIQGPYGSGKTQLLYHLLRFVWEKGAIGIYTHLEKLIPPHEMAAADYVTYLKGIVDEEVQSLRNGKSKLMSGRLGRVREYSIGHMKELNNEDHPIVIFVDEIEQTYKSLDEKIQTDDHSPMKETLRAVERGDAGFYLVLAFAPVSFYEFIKGEAQTRSFTPVMLPLLKASNLREAFGNLGNLLWWIGRGRYGWSLKVHDTLTINISALNECPKKEFLDVCRNIGLIGGVPSLVVENIETVEDFNGFREFLIRLQPELKGGEMFSAGAKIVKKCRICSEAHDLDALIEQSLRKSNISKVTDIGYYLSIVIDALTGTDGDKPVFVDIDDWRELLNMVGDIILEFEGEDIPTTQDIKTLQSDNDFVFNIRRDAEAIAPLKEAYCIAPRFLRSLFPFPISSPNLTNKTIEEQRENLGDQTYLGREGRDGVSILFFLNEDKIKEFLIKQGKEYLTEAKALLIVNLGQKGEYDLTKIAQWLKQEGRLWLATPRGILSDFLVSFFYWIKSERNVVLPLASLLQSLTDNQSITDKQKARKISYYSSRVREYLESEMPRVSSPKYILRDKTGFDPKIGYAAEVMGFAFVDNKNDLEAIYKFRQEFEKAQFVRSESHKKQTGVPTALPNLVVETKGKISKSRVLTRVNDSFGKHLPDLANIVIELDIDEFKGIPTDESSELIFEGIFLRLNEWQDPSTASETLQESISNWSALVKRINELSASKREFEGLLDRNILLTDSLENDTTKISNISKIIDEYRAKISPYTKFLLSEFLDVTREDIIEVKLSEIEKRFQQFKYNAEDEINRFRSSLEGIKDFEKDTFRWLSKTKGDVKNEFQEELRNACMELTQGGKLNLESIPDSTEFAESINDIADELQILVDIDESVKQCKSMAKKLNSKLKTWEVKKTDE